MGLKGIKGFWMGNLRRSSPLAFSLCSPLFFSLVSLFFISVVGSPERKEVEESNQLVVKWFEQKNFSATFLEHKQLHQRYNKHQQVPLFS